MQLGERFVEAVNRSAASRLDPRSPGTKIFGGGGTAKGQQGTARYDDPSATMNDSGHFFGHYGEKNRHQMEPRTGSTAAGEDKERSI